MNCAIALIDYQPTMYQGAVPITTFQYLFELQQDWARTETYEGVMEILRPHSPYGIQVRFSSGHWASMPRRPAPKWLNKRLCQYFDDTRFEPKGRIQL